MDTYTSHSKPKNFPVSLIKTRFETFKYLVYRFCNKTIAKGPFSGMKYIFNTHGSALTPKILGCYERELHPFMNEIIGKKYQKIIDIGAAEGYYAVGLAYSYLKAGHSKFRIHAFDTNERALQSLKKLAVLNNVEDYMEIQHLCTHQEINNLSKKDSFLICDIEGAETEVLDPIKASSLYHTDMLVELHDGNDFYITDVLRQRFEKSHNLKVVHFSKRKLHQAPRWLLFNKLKRASIDEGRTKGLKWMYLTVKKENFNN